MTTLSKTSEYVAWYNAIQRCHNPEHPAYKNYGARGIYVWWVWRSDILAAIMYVGKKPSREYTLERISNTDGYVPGNVKWAKWEEQANNRRGNTRLGQQPFTIDGITKTVNAWSKEYGIRSDVVQHRLELGYSMLEALTILEYHARRR